MIYNLNIESKRNEAIQKFKHLIETKSRIELKKLHGKRTLSQNAYLHLILGWFALEVGENLEYVKQIIFKQIVNEKYFKKEVVSVKTGEIQEFWLSTANLTKEEMSICTERFRNFASQEAGIYLPEPKDLNFLEEIQNKLQEYQNQIYQ